MVLTALLLAATISPFDEIVASERAFAAASLEKGLHEAFLEYLAPDAIGFLPLPGPARPSHEGKPKSTMQLSWGPTWAAVSPAGDIALSSGPWKISHNEKTPLNISTGWFFSVWQRQPDGTWKVAVDSGISSPVKFELPKAVENGFAGVPSASPRPGAAGNARIAVASAERTLAAAAKGGLGQAIEAHADAAIRVYREGQAAAFGAAAAKSLLVTDTRKMACTPDRIVTSASGTLGYAYGTCLGDGPDTTKYGFLRVWRMQPGGAWKILADVTP